MPINEEWRKRQDPEAQGHVMCREGTPDPWGQRILRPRPLPCCASVLVGCFGSVPLVTELKS